MAALQAGELPSDCRLIGARHQNHVTVMCRDPGARHQKHRCRIHSTRPRCPPPSWVRQVPSEIIPILTHACGSHTEHNNKRYNIDIGLLRGPLPTPLTTPTISSNVPPHAAVPTLPYDVPRPHMPHCAVIQVHIVKTIDM